MSKKAREFILNPDYDKLALPELLQAYADQEHQRKLKEVSDETIMECVKEKQGNMTFYVDGVTAIKNLLNKLKTD